MYYRDLSAFWKFVFHSNAKNTNRIFVLPCFKKFYQPVQRYAVKHLIYICVLYKHARISIQHFPLKILIAGVPNGCMDLRGNLVSDGEVFAPNRSDPCRMCSCENGETTKCNYIYCDAPPCERYKLVPGTCCGFICLENTNKPEGIVSNE